MEKNTAQTLDRLITTAGTVITVGIVCGFTYLGVKELAGKETTALINATMSTGNAINFTLMGSTGVASIWALIERRLRRVATRRYSARISQYEHSCDPNRSTSGLNEDGTTNRKDR